MDDLSPRDASERRRTPRAPAGWYGSYKLAGSIEAVWSQCRVLDISVAGVGFELFGPTPCYGSTERLVMRLESYGDTDAPTVALPGIIHNAALLSSSGCGSGSSSSVSASKPASI